MDPRTVLHEPYARVVVPEADGSFTAEILEFPGCVASGATAAEALNELEDVAEDWLIAEVEQGHTIPEPEDNSSYSGKLVVRMPKGLHKRATRWALRDGVSLNQFIVTCIAEHVGERAAMRIQQQPTFIQNTTAFFVFGQGNVPTYASTAETKFQSPCLTISSPWSLHAGHR